MEPLGPKLAEGRDGVIHEHGPGLVLRVVRDGRNLEDEARIMAWVRDHGVPVPRVDDVGDGWMVMERIEGRTLLDVAASPPFPLRRTGEELARLHAVVHEVPAPDWLRREVVAGDRVLHLDLHPLNVLMSPNGPVVIDWTNAAAGDPALDVADAWATFTVADPGPLSTVERLALPILRRRFVHHFLAASDHDAALRALPAACERRFWDPNWSDAERDGLVRLAEWAAAVTRS